MTQQSEKTPPTITEEEEIAPGRNREPLRDKKADIPLDFQKFSLGSTTLGWCIAFMLFCIVLSIWNPDNELIKSGFEAFKLIVMTILGYIFGSNTSRKE